MKAGILLSTYNKNGCLSNTLYAISRQRVSFDLEVCIVDDASTEDPKPIVDQFLPNAKYKRLDKHMGLPSFQSYCCELMDPNTDVVIIQSCDVMYLQDDSVQRLCDAVKPGYFPMAIVKNFAVGEDFHFASEVYGRKVEGLLSEWDQIQGINIYSGPGRPGGDWLLFLGAMTREDMFGVGFDYRCCDVVLQYKIRERGMKPIFLEDVKAVHQLHPPAHLYPCPIVDSCEYWCRRKRV